jgi:hypothetical protein
MEYGSKRAISKQRRFKMKRRKRGMKPRSLWLLVGVLIALCFVAPAGATNGLWAQANEDGFGPLACNSTWAMAYFNGQLYAGTEEPGRLFRTDGTKEPGSDRYVWEEVPLPTTFPGVEEFELRKISSMIVYETFGIPWLYVVASGRDSSGDRMVNVLFMSSDGTTWHRTLNVWDSAYHYMHSMEVFNGLLYVAMGDTNRVDQDVIKVLRTDGFAWELLAEGTTDIPLGDGDYYFGDMKAFGGYLYAGTSGINESVDRTAEIWRTADGTDWEKVADLHSPTMAEVESMEVFQNQLYVGTKNHPPEGVTGTGPELWRTRNGTDWEKVATEGQFNPNRLHLDTLLAFRGSLYAGVGGGDTPLPIAPATIYTSYDGTTWEDVTPEDLAADSDNYMVGSMAEAWNALFFGTGMNMGDGTEIWHTWPVITLPIEIPEWYRWRPEFQALFLIDCGPCPMCFARPCDPRVNLGYDQFLIWDPRLDIAESFSRSMLKLRPEDGPLMAAAPVLDQKGQFIFVAAAPYADSIKAADTGALLFFSSSGEIVGRLDGEMPGERLGLEMDVRGDEVVAISTQGMMRLKGGDPIYKMAFKQEDLHADRRAHVAFTDDIDGDKRPEILLGTPYATVGKYQEAGQIQVIGSKSGEIIDVLYGGASGQHLGEILYPADLGSGK